MLPSTSVSPSTRPRLNPDRAQLEEEEEAGGFSSSPGRSSFLDLPSVVLQRVLSHFDFSERLDLALALQNRRMLAEIETYCKRVYERIKKDHHADATFDERVNDQSNLPNSSSTGRQKPYTLSWRYRATSAMKKPLWTITVGNNPHDMASQLVLSPLENRIAFLAEQTRSTAHVYELATRQHVGSFGRNPVQLRPDLSLDDYLQRAFLLENNRVITYSNVYWNDEVQHIFRIWTKSDSGEWTSERLLPEGTHWLGEAFIFDWIPRNDQETIFFVKGANLSQVNVVSVNIDDKLLKTLYTVTGFPSIYRVRAQKVVDSKWLLFEVGGFGKGCGLYVYNLETNQKTDFHAVTKDSYFYDIQQASDCPKTFFAFDSPTDSPTVVVWGLSDTGLVSERFSFSVEFATSLLAATKSHVFLWLFNGGVSVYNVSTGKCCRYLGWDVSWPSVISSSRDELYTAGPRNRLQAFCLKEPPIM